MIVFRSFSLILTMAALLSAAQTLDKWHYVKIDSARASDVTYVGLAFSDVNLDGKTDVVAGRYVYLNQGGQLTSWQRITFADNIDALLAVDVDGDTCADLIGERLPDVYWLEADSRRATSWHSTKIGTLTGTGHASSIAGAACAVAQIIPGGKPEIILADAATIYYFQIPSQPGNGNWPKTVVTNQDDGQGLAVGDLDGDGDLDIASAGGPNGWADAMKVCWWENPGNGQGNWTRHEIFSMSSQYMSRCKIADMNGDGKLDIIVSDGEGGAGEVWWLEQPATSPRTAQWQSHRITSGLSVPQGLDVADMDGDGDMDVVVGEVIGQMRNIVYENTGSGLAWQSHLVASGVESHYGDQTADLDGDGDLDIVNVCWFDHQSLHLFRNDAITSGTAVNPWRGSSPLIPGAGPKNAIKARVWDIRGRMRELRAGEPMVNIVTTQDRAAGHEILTLP